MTKEVDPFLNGTLMEPEICSLVAVTGIACKGTWSTDLTLYSAFSHIDCGQKGIKVQLIISYVYLFPI